MNPIDPNPPVARILVLLGWIGVVAGGAIFLFVAFSDSMRTDLLDRMLIRGLAANAVVGGILLIALGRIVAATSATAAATAQMAAALLAQAPAGSSPAPSVPLPGVRISGAASSSVESKIKRVGDGFFADGTGPFGSYSAAQDYLARKAARASATGPNGAVQT